MKKTGLVLWPVMLVAVALHLDAQQPPASGAGSAAAASPPRRSLQRTIGSCHARFRGYGSRPAGVSGQSTSAALKTFAQATQLVDQQSYSKALPLLMQPSVLLSPVGAYAQYYAAVAELRLDRPAQALRLFRGVQARPPVGYLSEAAAMGEAEAAEALGDHRAAVEIYDTLSKLPSAAPDEVLMRLANAAKATGDTARAVDVFARVYFDFPTSESAPSAGVEYDALPGAQRLGPRTARYRLELARAERLFDARRYTDARAAFQRLAPFAEGDDRELVNLRIAESDYFLKRWRNARDGVRPYVDRAARRAEALYFYALSLRELGEPGEYLKIIRRIPDEFPAQSWAEDALNNLATYHVRADHDAEADAVFRELYSKYPRGRYAERAAWKIGWRSYRERRYDEVPAFFERAAADFPRSDYRPMWLYWAGRAHEALHQTIARARALRACRDRLPQFVLRAACGQTAPDPAASARVRGRWGVAAAAGERAAGANAAAAGPLRRGVERASVRAADVGRLGGDSSDDRLDLPAAGPGGLGIRTVQAAPRVDYDDAARLSPVSGGRWPGTAAGDADGDLPARLLGRDPQVFELRRTSTLTSSPRWWCRNRPSCPTCVPRRTRSASCS